MIPISYNVRSLIVRRTTTLAAVIGVALVVFVLASALMLSDGIGRTMSAAGKKDEAIVLRKGSNTEMASGVENENVSLILAAPGVRHYADGRPMGIAEIVAVIALDKIGTSGLSNVQLRGTQDSVYDFRPEVKIVDGRKATPGTDEVVVGKAIRGRFKGLDIGQTFELRKNRPAKVVGVFEAGGSTYESEVWLDLDTMRAAFGRQGAVSSVRAALTDASAFDGFQAAVEEDKRLGLGAQKERDYYEAQGEQTATFISYLGTIISVFFAVGAMIGAMITMYASIASRSREIGTLRALGFARRTVLGSFLLEAIFIALAGGVLGAVAAMGMGTVKLSMMNFESWSEIVFSFHPTIKILVTALVFSGGMGLLGGLFPAVRAARLSPTQAMRGE
jgi:putative ABC transport system permease protein